MLKSYPLNIPKVQSKGSKISNLGQNFIFTENCTLIIHMNHFSYPLTIVQINIFEEPGPKISFPTKIPDPKLSSQPPVFLTIECPPGTFGLAGPVIQSGYLQNKNVNLTRMST